MLATGGAGKCWRITSNSWECTGDGHALAYEAGAELIDMEFVQFHPTGMVWPPGVVGLLVTEAVRGEGGILRNASGERFMERYDPKRLELSTRDVVARAIFTEVKEGRGTPHGGVFLDVSHLGDATVKRKLPSMYDQFMELAGVDITREPMEVGPTCHYFMGGIRVDAETGAEHGRGAVRGRRVLGRDERRQPARRQLALGSARVRQARGRGRGASTRAAAPAPRIDDAQVARRGGRDDAATCPDRATRIRIALHAELQATMQEDVGIFRDEAGLTAAVARLERAASARAADARCRVGHDRLQPRLAPLPRPAQHADRLAEAVARAALLRHESRGAHSRLDFPALRRLLGRAQHRRAQGRATACASSPGPSSRRAELGELVETRARRPSDA